MTTDRELDQQLRAARGFQANGVPELPREFLDYLRASETADGDEGVRTASPRFAGEDSRPSVIAAQQLVTDAHHRRDSASRARPGRRPRRTIVLRVGAAVLAVAAAWGAAVAVAPASRPPAVGTTAAPQTGGQTTPGAIELVSVEEQVFPVSLEPAPEGLEPEFSRRGNESATDAYPEEYVADYRDIDPVTNRPRSRDGFTLWVWPEDPRGQVDVEPAPDQYDSIDRSTVTIQGSPAELVLTANETEDGTATYSNLFWQLPNGWWARIAGNDAYSDAATITAVANSVVDRPQPLGLQFGLAPAGWTASSYESSNSVDLTNDADPTQSLRLSVYTPGPGYEGDIEGFYEGVEFVSPITPVTIMGLPGLIAMHAGYTGDNGYPPYWTVAGNFADGRIFLMLAPQALTQEQVLQIADQIVYN